MEIIADTSVTVTKKERNCVLIKTGDVSVKETGLVGPATSTVLLATLTALATPNLFTTAAATVPMISTSAAWS